MSVAKMMVELDQRATDNVQSRFEERAQQTGNTHLVDAILTLAEEVALLRVALEYK